jgi:hypothetical protein
MSGEAAQTAWPLWRILLWAGLVALAATWFGSSFVDSLSPPEGTFLDFGQEWLSAQNLVHGRPVYQDQTVAVTYYTRQRPKWILQWNAHPPTSVLLAVPFTALDYPTAHLAWNLLSLAALGVSLFLVARQLGLHFPWMLLPATALLLVCWPFHLQVVHAQLNLILLLLVVGTWALDRTDRPWAAGALLGAAAAIKLFPAFLFVYFLLRRRWQALGAAVVSLLVLTGLTLAVEGWDAYRTYVTQVLPSLTRFRSSWQNVSVLGFWSRLFDPQLVGEMQILPLARLPWLVWPATALCIGLIVALLAPVVWRARSRDEGDGAFALATTAMLLASPITWVDYFLLLLLPVVWLWLRLAGGWPRWMLVAVLVPLWTGPDVIYYVCLGLNSEKLANLFEGRTATPGQALTMLSVQFYALLALFAVGLFAVRRRGASG